MNIRRHSRILGTHSLRGFTLLEVLITILVVSVGLLGLAALQAFSLKADQSANFRTQATSMAYMIIDRMRGHGGGPLTTATAYYGNGSDDRAQRDLKEWRALIQSSLPDGTGTLVFDAGSINVQIQWTDARWAISSTERCSPTATPTSCTFSMRTSL